MPVYLYWGEDDFALQRAAKALRDQVLDPNWTSFNLDKIPPEQPDAVLQALNQAMTMPFGAGSRFVWLVDTPLCQRCSEELLAELERTLPVIPDATVLLLTTTNKPDGRIKSTKLLQRHAEIREFSPIPPWKTDLLMQQTRQAAQEVGVKLTADAIDRLVEAVGNHSRQLYTELEKLKLYAASPQTAIDAAAVDQLVTTSTQSSLQLAAAIRQGDTARTLTLLEDLFRQNESPLRIVATLITQFRLWLWIKLMVESGERDERAIAQAAEVGNAKRIYFLQQEVRSVRLDRLLQTLPLLLELEVGLKQGAEAVSLMQTKAIELCQLFRSPV